MYKIKSYIIALFALVSSCLSVKNAYGQLRKYSNEFLSIGVGARSLGMAKTNTAIADDATAGFYNPANLVFINTDRQIALMHANYFAGIAKYDYGALAAKINEQSSLCFSLIRFGVDDIPNTTELIDAEGNIHYDRITSFSAVDYGIYLSYGRKLKIPNLNLGGSAKIVHRKAGDFAKSWGFGIDIAGSYTHKNWKFGALAKDITTTYNAWSFSLDDKMKALWTQTGNTIPKNSVEITLPKLILGSAYQYQYKEKLFVLLSTDLDINFDKKRNVFIKTKHFSFDPHFGTEFSYKKIIFLRAGIGNFQKETNDNDKKFRSFQPDMGLGINIKDILLVDYALTDIGDRSIALYSNIFSLKFNIKKKN